MHFSIDVVNQYLLKILLFSYVYITEIPPGQQVALSLSNECAGLLNALVCYRRLAEVPELRLDCTIGGCIAATQPPPSQ